VTRWRHALVGAVAALALTAPTVASAATAASAASPASELRWDMVVGDQQVVRDSLFGGVTIVPGHDQTRTLVVHNDGDLPGRLVVTVVDARLHQAPRDGFFDGLTVNGVSASALASQVATTLHVGTLAAGESAEVPVRLALAGSGGNAALVGQQTFSFAVRMVLSGETPAVPGSPDGPVAQTGGLVRETGPWLLLGAAALALALVLARRRREEEEPA